MEKFLTQLSPNHAPFKSLLQSALDNDFDALLEPEEEVITIGMNSFKCVNQGWLEEI